MTYTIQNPIIAGMAPDPSIIRVEDTYYIATSTFHWTPAIQLFQSTDLVNWELVDHALKLNQVHLRGTNTPAGIWAPHLSYDPVTKKFWLAYSHMLNMAGREFNADSYAIWAYDITGPWSEPIFLTAIGFDPAIFHDDDGKKYVTILEWETREGYQAPGHIVIAELNLDTGKLIGNWHRLTHGFTTRGCAEAPQIYKRNGYYYLLLAAGGTGYAHGIEIGRSKHIFGPYEPHPSGEPIVTSAPKHLFSLGDPDAGHFEMYNPTSPMQKAGHGSLVETPNGEWYMTHLMSRPLTNTLLNPLGRETSIQKMHWTDDDWLEMTDGSNLAKLYVSGPVDYVQIKKDSQDLEEQFTNGYSNLFLTPYREQTPKWVNTSDRPGCLRIYGENSLFSQMNPAIMATRATSFSYTLETALEFYPKHYSEKAGLGFYYDSNNWLFIHITYSEPLDAPVLTILQAKLGQRIEFYHNQIPLPVDYEQVKLKIHYHYGIASIYYSVTTSWEMVLDNLDVTYLSDEGVNGEPGEIGGFTGLFNFIGAVDAYQRTSYADFHYYKVQEIGLTN